jgi:deazaflavin-dependent oxidoreductase (nitroreductase family)
MKVAQRAHWRRLLDWIPSSRLGAHVLAHTLYHIDRPLLRLTHGRLSLPGILSGLPIVLLTTTGARSGRQHTVPLAGVPVGDKVVLIASYYGRSRHPAWYHNLRKHPQAHLTLPDRAGTYVAREVDGTERDLYWREAVALYGGFAAYQRLAGERKIPVLVLAPAAVS